MNLHDFLVDMYPDLFLLARTLHPSPGAAMLNHERQNEWAKKNDLVAAQVTPEVLLGARMFPDRPVQAIDHARAWFNPVTNEFVLTLEPYPTAMVPSDRPPRPDGWEILRAWADRMGWKLDETTEESPWNPGGTVLIVLRQPTHLWLANLLARVQSDTITAAAAHRFATDDGLAV